MTTTMKLFVVVVGGLSQGIRPAPVRIYIEAESSSGAMGVAKELGLIPLSAAESCVYSAADPPRLPYELVILDVDGTVVKTKSGATFRQNSRDWEPIDGRYEVVQRLHAEGARVALASNQGGVAFGYLAEEEIVAELHRLADWLDISREAVFYCPFHPDGTIPEYRGDSLLRKPRPGMLFAAMRWAGSLPAYTLMVGDRPEDQEAAKNAGCAFVEADRFFAEPWFSL